MGEASPTGSLYSQARKAFRHRPPMIRQARMVNLAEGLHFSRPQMMKGRNRKICRSQATYQPQEKQPSCSCYRAGKKLMVIVKTDHQY